MNEKRLSDLWSHLQSHALKIALAVCVVNIFKRLGHALASPSNGVPYWPLEPL